MTLFFKAKLRLKLKASSRSSISLLGGRWTADGQRGFVSVQRVFALKRAAVSNARSRAGTSRDDKVSGFRCGLYGKTEEAPIRSGLRDNSLSSHPEMLLFRIWAFLRTVVRGSGSVVGKSKGSVPSCELHVRIDSIQTDVGACGCTPAVNNDQSSQG